MAIVDNRITGDVNLAGDLAVICGQLVTCSGDVRCCSSSSSEVDAPCR